jgi:hypothetical protein
MIDRYLKMNGVQPTNKPNPRALRKMMAGNFTEAVVLYIFQRAGILQHSQQRFESDWTPLSVHGKSDIIIGGRPNIDQARSAASQFLYFPEMYNISMKVIEGIMDVDVPEMLYEVKSIATYKADEFERLGDKAKPIPNHQKQTGFYTIERNVEHSILSYICRDDLRMTEFYVFNTPELQRDIYKDVETIKGYLDADQRPPMEEKIVMEDGRFRKNFNIEYSNYLTLLYGYEEPRDYSDEVSKTIAKWNRVIARYKANALDPSKKITDLNKSAREEIEMSGHDFNEILTNFVEEQTEEE